MIDKKLWKLWEQRFKGFETSGKTIAAWCKEQSIRENQFFYWRKKLRSDQSEQNQSVKWLAVDLNDNHEEEPAANSISMHIGQVVIEVNKGFDKQLLQDILKVLRSI